MSQRYVLAIHGGAGTIAPSADRAAEEAYHAALRDATAAGQAVLAAGGKALDAAVAAVVALEDCPLFNAGRGSVYTSDAVHEMDASVMDGRTQAAGAVACVRNVRNPVVLARAVMEHSNCVLLTSDGAERFARERGIPFAPSEYFATKERLDQLHRAIARQSGAVLDHSGAADLQKDKSPINPDQKFGTVGAVALDRDGNLASAVSTGGLTNKKPGRIGDTPVIGAGCYANNQVAVAATGTGEYFIRAVAAYDIAARMNYGGATLEAAARATVFDRLNALGGSGGLIALDRDGNLATPFNTSGMYRAWVYEQEEIVTRIFL